jgi:catechol 2,3-dioxygenase-like lactoylglutathione lyase family enzyme
MKTASGFRTFFGFSTLLLAAWVIVPAPVRGADSNNEFTKGTIDIGIVVRDAARTTEFLTNAVGFTEVKGFSVTPDLGKRVGLIDGHAVNVRMFTLTEGDQATRIKVLEFPKAETNRADQQFIHSTFGIRYLTLYVEDMKRAVERLKAAKVPLLGETPLDLGSGTYIAVFKDPDGNFMELIGPMPK